MCVNTTVQCLIKERYICVRFLSRGLPLITYASRGGGGYKGGGGGGLNMTKICILYAGLLKMQQYLTHLRIDNSSISARTSLCSCNFYNHFLDPLLRMFIYIGLIHQ